MNDSVGSVFIEDPSGNTWLMDGKGNISVNAPKNFSINAGENITLTAGMNVSTSAGMNISESAGIDKMTNVAAIHSVFIGGNSVVNVMGKLTEIIEGDVHSETKKGKTTINSEKGIESINNGSVVKHSEKEIHNNSAEKNKQF